ncbi:MAG: non-homologous end joining protein Ku [Bdellovibrionota bacterium]
MPKKTTAKKTKKTAKHSNPRGLWKGSIAFGLVNIPIILESAVQEERLHFHLVDKKDHAPIGYRQINKKTGREIKRSNIIKGYEYEKGKYVLLSDADFEKANVKATRMIEIEDFVELEKVDPMLFERPYYVIPQKGGEKGYVLLRETLKRSKKAGIAKLVLHTVQRLVALVAKEDYITLEILRFANEVKELHEVDYLDPSIKKMKVSEREVAVAEQLVHGMSSDWNPDKYHNTYQDDLKRLIQKKIKGGQSTTIEKEDTVVEDIADTSNVVDLTALLKRSLSAAKGAHKTPKNRKAA